MYRRSIAALVVIVVILGLEVRAPAIIRRHDRDDANYLKLGEKYPAVTRLGGATATLIAPQWLITAGHAANALSPFDRSVRFGDKRYMIDGVVIHPGWKARSGPSSIDLALIRLSEPVAGVSPVAIYEKDDEVGQEIVFVGIGQYGDGNNGPIANDGRKRGATNKVASVVAENWLTFVFDAPPNGTELEGISGPGDSGGPALLEIDNRNYIIGVSSANDDKGAAGPCRYGSTEYYARVSTSKQWIRETVEKGSAGEVSCGLIIDLKSKEFPASRAGEIARAFFSAYAGGTDDSMRAFEESYRAAKPSADRPLARRLESWRKLRAGWGDLSPARYVVARDGSLWVLVYTDGAKMWQTFRFMLEPESPQKLMGIEIAGPVSSDD